ncbi:MAG: fibronectin type III domain-containing protein [Dysgonamonadaceae bacterium]|jgi:hypothetical protein|nr:fibronectin type III domain-containing protein [Dysgonamonadaceae bacterium]
MKIFEKIYIPLRDKRRASVLIFFIFLIGIGSLYAQQTTVRLQPRPNLFGLTNSASGFSLQATNTNVLVGRDNNVTGRGYLYFDLSSIPQDATINSAMLQLTVNPSSSANFDGNFTLRRADFVLNGANETMWRFLAEMGENIEQFNFSNGTGRGVSIASGQIQNGLALGSIAFSIIHRSESSRFMRFNMSENSAFLEVTYTPRETVAPGVPTNLSANNITTNSVALSWTRPTGTVTGYRIYRNDTFLQTATATTATISNLSPNTTYRFSISAVNGANASARSQEITVHTLSPPPTISGPTLICSGESSVFTIQNMPTGASVAWTHSPNLQRVSNSGNTATFRMIGNGEGWVEATVNGASARRLVWCGIPHTDGMDVFVALTGIPFSRNLCWSTDHTLAVQRSHLRDDGITRYDWFFGSWAPFVTNSRAPSSIPNQHRDIRLHRGQAPSTQIVTATAINRCSPPGGGSDILIRSSFATVGAMFHVVDNCFGRALPYTVEHPNPVSTILPIQITPHPQQIARRTSLMRVNGTINELQYDIRLYDSEGNRVRQMASTSNTAQLNISTLPDGDYYLHIYDGIDIVPIVQKIIIENR